MRTIERKELLIELLNLSRDLTTLKDELSKFVWDSDEIVILEASHLNELLRRYLENKVNDTLLTDWASIVELRDDIGYGFQHEELIKRIIFELANPEINGRLTPKLAIQYSEMLS